jgi:hypothetical protein
LHAGFWWENPRERKKNLEDLGIDERIILKRTFRKTNGGMDRVYLAQDRDNHQDLLMQSLRPFSREFCPFPFSGYTHANI